LLEQIEQRLRPDIVIFYNVDVLLLESTGYYGTYSNVSRGKRKKEKPKREEAVSWKPEVIEDPPPTISKELKKRWSHFIQKVYETDPQSVSSGHWPYPCGSPHQAAIYFPTIHRMQFNSSLIESWGLNTEQTQAQNGSKANQN